jgi:hypothetical protein
MNSSYQSLLPLHQNGEGYEESTLLSRKRTNDLEEDVAPRTTTKANDDDDVESSFLHDTIFKHMKKRPTLVLSIMLLLACTVGHTLTVMYYWDNIKYNHKTIDTAPSVAASAFLAPPTNIHTTATDHEREMEKTSKKEAQEIATRQKKDELDTPSLESQTYYNKTFSGLLEKFQNEDKKYYPLKLMGKSHVDNESSKKSTDPPMPPPPSDCQATLMIIRHCEKGNAREHCDSLGTFHNELVIHL